MQTVQAWCEAASCDPVVCAHVLAGLEEEQIETIMRSDSFNVVRLSLKVQSVPVLFNCHDIPICSCCWKAAL